MKALILKRYGGAKHLALADIPRPVPRPDEILVQVHAAGLNMDFALRSPGGRSLAWSNHSFLLGTQLAPSKAQA
jgi:NADPH:quinone reductase-like Zn-dependent oxidoreductase